MQKRGFPAVIVAVCLLGLVSALGGCQRDTAGGSGGPQYDANDRLGTAGSPWKGAADGVVTIVEFSSFQCPYCGRVQPTLKKLLEEFPNDLRLVFKQHPLPFQQDSGPAAEAALEAHAQGKFWPYHELLMANQRALARPDLERYAEQVGLDMDRFGKALDEGTHKTQVQKDLETAAAAGIRGTPGFLINGKRLAGAQPFDAFAAVVREEIETTRELVADGKSLGEAYAARLETNLAAQVAEAERQEPPQPDPNAKMAVPVGESPVKGGQEPLVRLVEFSSYQCPFCARVRGTVEELMTEYGDDLQVVFKHRPLGFQQNSEPAARAAIAAGNQGKFWEYHDVLFANQRELGPESFVRWAEELDLDVERFRSDMESEATRARLAEDTGLADRLGAQGTPHFFINGYRLVGAQPAAAFKALIDREMAVASDLVESGTPRAEVYAKQQADAITGPPPTVAGAAPEPAAPVAIKVGDSIAIGPRDAKVTLVEFYDYKCGFCGRLAAAMSEVKPDYRDRVLFVKKQFPLGRWPESEKAAQAALAAHAQGKYDEFSGLVYENQRTFDDEMLYELAERTGLDMDRFRAELEDGKWAAQVRKDVADGRSAGVSGTPALFLNGQRIGGALSAEQLRAALDQALSG